MAAENDIREAMASAISAVSGFRVDAYVPGQPQPPCIYILPGELRYHQASADGMATKTFTVWAVLPLVDDREPQRDLGTLRDVEGAGSLKAALEFDRTLGGLVDELLVASATPVQDYVLPQSQAAVLACQWNVEVMD